MPAFSLTDLNHYIQKITPSEDDDEETSTSINTEILNNALEFKTVKVRECMIPRIDIVGVEIEESVEKLRETFIQTGYSKIVIYKDNIDNVVGYVHSSVLFKKPDTIEDVLSNMIIVPETFQANELLPRFTSENKSIALVVDEFGGTAGIVTIEDVIEEIIGEIQDEHDDNGLVEIQIDDNSYIFSARHEINYLNEKYHLNIPEEEYDTLGGFILHLTGDIPKEGEIVVTPKFKILVKTMEGIRIDKVQIFVTNG
ncbi:hemolysin family protein [Cyclobacteriaceae bacterium]|nr:hemolysin family protein [Cyclobacteriaceae bacterium]